MEVEGSGKRMEDLYKRVSESNQTTTPDASSCARLLVTVFDGDLLHSLHAERICRRNVSILVHSRAFKFENFVMQLLNPLFRSADSKL